MAKILVVGNGGREHAIADKFYREKHEIFMFGQNPGVAKFGTCLDIKEDEIVQFCKENNIDLVFIGPEAFLVKGLVDELENQGIRAFGPRKNAAILEGSKAFSKEFMKKYDIPTAKFEIFTDYNKVLQYLEKSDFPIVIKADGIAAGKGVIIAENFEHAKNNLEEIMLNNKFSDAGKTVVIEEFLEGEEFSLMSFISRDKVFPMKIAQDHKRAFDGDKGLNTGGMGAYMPIKHITEEDVNEAIEKIVSPTADAMLKEGREFKGILFAGLMKTKDGIKTIEYNVRFGDPESEIILQSLKTSLYDIANAIIDGKDIDIKWDNKAHVGVALASKGYPESYQKGFEIKGLDKVSSKIFHMGTKYENGVIKTNGGRVLIVCAESDDLETAIEKVYEDIHKIHCDNLFYRKDIGHLSLK
ncbi:phosphoribosylamine-glycine ligase [Helcococcus kunzii ATCC 51366]|uniref:Phosphoribosylamine--glycine ligase n=1 Tax=Helcococcus kunzii ATCC 51366 TaxID=883114 RepID=H3NMG1_9FIRM|nr:phosphoribosylamine--glycine ligase [Helcococcus kunzii]EHR35047.1 phosphoribosylamine-glycine ligase [Helcococcus kunzii ATCC 51366]